MKHKRNHALLFIVLLLVLFRILLFVAFNTYPIWNMNAPSHVNVVFPYGTQIIRKTDTHQGLFRRNGTAVTVAQIPPDAIQSFSNRLIDEGFWQGVPYDEPYQRLELIPEAKIVLESGNFLWTYRDEAVALIEEPFSDWFAAVYDLDTGLLCYIEYDE